MSRIVVVLACIAAAAGCSKKKEATAESCGQLTATLDGKPLQAMTHGLARAMSYAKDNLLYYEVQVANLDKTTCDQFANKEGTPIPEGQIAVTAVAGGDGPMGRGVRFDANTQAGIGATLLTPPPKTKGDKVQICVEETTIEVHFGPHKGAKLVVSGLFEGGYCGEIRW